MANLALFLKSEDFEEFRAGDVVFREGDVGDRMFVVKEGEVEVRVGDRLVDTLGSGRLVGEMALIDGGARSATVVACSDSKLVPIDEKRFVFLVQQTPFFAVEVMREIVARVRSMNRKD